MKHNNFESIFHVTNILFLLGIIIFWFFILLIYGGAVEYATHTGMLEYVEFNPLKELVLFIILKFIYICIILLFYKYQKRRFYDLFFSLTLVVLHLFNLLRNLIHLIIISDISFKEIICMVYISLLFNMIIVIISATKFYKVLMFRKVRN